MYYSSNCSHSKKLDKGRKPIVLSVKMAMLASLVCVLASCGDDKKNDLGIKNVLLVPNSIDSYRDDYGTIVNTKSTITNTDDPTPTLNIAKNLEGAKLYIDNKLVDSIYVSSEGTLTSTVPVAVGKHEYSYSIMDAAMGESAQSEALSLNIVASVNQPSPIKSYQDNIGNIQSNSSTANTTDDDTPALNIDKKLKGVKLYIDGQPVISSYDINAGTLIANTSVAIGSHEYTYSVSDDISGESPKSDSLILTVVDKLDAPTPLLSYQDNVGNIQNSDSGDSETDDTTPTLNISKQLSDVKLYINGQIVAANYDAATGTLVAKTPASVGKNIYTYTFIDPVKGLSPQSDTLTLTIVAPSSKPAPIKSYQDNIGGIQDNASTADTTDDNTPTLNIDNKLSGFKLYIDGQPVDSSYDSTAGTLIANSPTTNGKHEYTYSTSDAITGESPKSDPFTLIIIDDTNIPIPLQSYRDNTGNIQSAQSTASRTDDQTPSFNIDKNLAEVELYINDQVVVSSYNAALGTLMAETPATVGTYQYNYRFKHPVKGISPQSNPLTLTIVGPAEQPSLIESYQDNVGGIQNTASVNGITDDATPTLNIDKMQLGVRLYVDGQEVTSTYNTNTGALVANSPAIVGAHQYTYSVSDDITGESPLSNPLAIAIVEPAIQPVAIVSYQDDVGNVQSQESVAATTDDNTATLNIPKNLAAVNLYIDGMLVDSIYKADAGTIVGSKPVLAGEHTYSYSVLDTITGESPLSAKRIIKLDTLADIEEEIRVLTEKLENPSVPFTTEEEIANSKWADKTTEELLYQARKTKQQQLALYADDPDPEWFVTSVSDDLTIVKPNNNYSVQFYKKDYTNTVIGVVDTDLLRLELRMQTADGDVQYIPAEYHAQYVEWDLVNKGQLNVAIPSTMTEGRLIVGVRPKTEDLAQKALTERWSKLATFEVWNTKAGVISLDESQVAFPKKDVDNELASDSAFTEDEIIDAMALYMEDLVIALPIVVYDTTYQEGDLIDYMVDQRLHSGQVHKVIETRGNQQLLILAPEIAKVYDYIIDENDSFKDMGIEPEFVVFRSGDKVEDPNQPESETISHIGPSDRTTIQALPKWAKFECTGVTTVGGSQTFTHSLDFDIFSSDPGVEMSLSTSVSTANGAKVECKLSVEAKEVGLEIEITPANIRPVLHMIGAKIVLAPIIEGKVVVSANQGNATVTATVGARLSIKKGLNPSMDISTSGDASGSGLLGDQLAVKGEIGVKLGAKVELKLIELSAKSGGPVGWALKWLNKKFPNSDITLDLRITGQGSIEPSQSVAIHNAAYVYQTNKSSNRSKQIKGSVGIAISTGITKIFKYVGVKIEGSYSISDSITLLKQEAKYKVDNVEDNGSGNASAELTWATGMSGINKMTSGVVSGYASISDESSSVFNDYNGAIGYEIQECRDKGDKIITPFVGCTGGSFCGTSTGTADLCAVKQVSISPTSGGGMEGTPVTSSTTVSLSGDYSSSADPSTEYNVSVSGGPLSPEISSVALRLNGSKTIKTTAICPSMGETPTSVTATFGDSTETAEGTLTCSCNPDIRECDKIWGDPYLVTADGLAYDFLASGDYILQRIVDDNNKPIPGLEVQGRFLPGYDVSWVHGAAMRIGSDVVEVTPAILGHGLSSIGMEIKVNGDYVYRPAVGGTGGTYEPLLNTRIIELPGGGKIFIDSFVQQHFTYKPAKITMVWPRDGDFKGYALTLSVPEGQFTDPEPFIDFQFARPTTHAGFERGLMGNNDGNPDNDLMRRNGDIISTQNMSDRTQFYSLFGGDWLPKGRECLFSDGCLQPDFPTRDVVLTPDQRALGEYVCSDLAGFYKEACIHDVGLTGNVELVMDAYRNSEDKNYMADKLHTITINDAGLQAGIYKTQWRRSAIIDQAFTVKAVVDHIQGDGGYQIVSVPPEGATVQIDGEAYTSNILSSQDTRTHNISVDCKSADPIFEDFNLGDFGHVQIWNVNPETGYTDVLLDETRLSCDTSQRMASGLHHNLLLDNDGKLWSWGSNDKGQLGTGGVSNSANYVPKRVKISDDIAERITFIAAGDNHNIALDNNANLWAWGDNTYGQLGNGSNDYQDPVQVNTSAINTEDNKIVSVQAGGQHSLALYDNGEVWGWGRSNRGQLGNGDQINMTTPSKIDLTIIDKPVIQIAAGNSHTLALDAAGEVWAWGDNTHGQIGSPIVTSDFSTSPVKVNMEELAGAQVIGIAAGLNHNLVLDDLGRLWAWGDNRDHQLGNDQFTDAMSNTPVLVSKLDIGNYTEILSINAGGNHSAVFDGEGKVWTWGNNSKGQLGINDSIDKSTPTLMKLTVSEGADVSSFVLGLDSTMILDTKGYLFSTGNKSSMHRTLDSHSPNYYSVGQSLIPQVFTKLEGEPEFYDFNISPVSGASSVLGSRVDLGKVNGRTLIPLGGSETLKVSDNLYAGHRKFTTITLDRTTSVSFETSTNCGSYGDHTLTYRLNDSEGNALTNDAMLDYTCYPDLQTKWKVDQDNGNVYLVVTNKSEQASNATLKVNDDATQATFIPNQAQEFVFNSLNCNVTEQTGENHVMGIDSILNSKSYYSQDAIFYPASSCGNGLIDVGFSHSLTASSKGQLWSWGSNHNGQLGINYSNYYSRNTPSKVSMEGMTLGSITAFATGNQHNIAIDVDTNTLWAWGDNTYGQLGNGDSGHSGNSYKYEPVRVNLTNTADATFVSVDSGYYHNLALDTQGQIWAWGANFHGELGINNTDSQAIPVAVDMSPITQTNAKVTTVATGFYHSVALDDNGQVWTWGYNHLGQLGLPDDNNQLMPTAIDISAVTASGAKVINVIAGDFHNLLLDDQGRLWTWGDNSSGQLGNNQTIESYELVQVNQSNLTVGSAIKKIVAGGSHNMVLLKNGEIYAWGNNDSGVLGANGSTNQLIPTNANQSNMGDAIVLNIATASGHSLALDNYGQIWAWGNNRDGQLGTNAQSGIPIKVHADDIDDDNQTD